MKKFIIVFLILILAATPVVFAACSRVSQTDMLSDPYIADNAEIFTYKIYHATDHGKDLVGEMTLTFRKVKAEDVVLQDPTAENNERTISAFSGTRLSMAYKMDGVYNSDEGFSEVLYANDYSPVYSYKHTSIGGTVKDMCVVYDTKYAYTYLYENGEKKKEAEVKVKNTTHFDNEMIYTIVRASNVSYSSYTMSFYSPNALTASLESISVSKVKEVGETGLAWVTPDENGESMLPCYLMSISIANTYAKSYSMYVSKNKINATFHKKGENDEDIEYEVSGVTKAIVKIEEGAYSYILDRIEIL